MKGKQKIKSFNGGARADVIRAVMPYVALAIAVALALPHAFQHLAVPALQHTGPFMGPLAPASGFPDVEPEWGLLTGLPDALSSGQYGSAVASLLAACTAYIALLAAAKAHRAASRRHDGTWLGPRRVDGDPGGSARIVSRHRDLKRLLAPWDGRRPPESGGLPVAYFEGRFWLLGYVNALVHGAPGCGKTRRVILPAVCAHLDAGDSVLCLDPKGEVRDFTEGYAEERGYRVVRLMVDDPACSPDSFNPLAAAVALAADGRVDDAVAEVGSIAKVVCPTKSKGSPHFDDSARALLEGLMLAVATDPAIPDDARSLATVGAIASLAGSDGETGLDRIRSMARSLPVGHPAKSKLSQAANTGDEEASSIVSTLVARLNDYVDARVSRMLWKTTFSFEDMARGKTVVYLSFSNASGNYGKLVTTLVSGAIGALRREAARQGGHLGRECYLLLEEFAQMDRIETLYADAGVMRGEGIHLLVVLQEKSQLLTKYTREEAASLTGCCDDTLVLSVNELEVARELSGKIGTYAAFSSTSSESRGQGGGPVGPSSTGSTASSQRRDLITPDELLRWGPDVGNLLIGHGGVYALPSPDLSATFLEGDLGLGGRARNDAIRAGKAAHRKAVNGPAPFWLPGGGDEEEPAAAVPPQPARRGYNPLRPRM